MYLSTAVADVVFSFSIWIWTVCIDRYLPIVRLV